MINEKTGYYDTAKGGTELMRERIFNSVNLDGIQVICSRLRELEPNKKHKL